MIDLSFLTEEEQEAIMKVLQRDAELKRAEEERVRHLPEKVKDDVQLKNMSGQWFYEAKSKRHRDKIHGADIIRASMRRKPATPAEVSQNKTNKAKNSWVSNVNKEVFVSPELHGIVEHQEEEEQLKSSSSSKTITSLLDTPQERPMKEAISPVKQRRNPFNSTASGDNLNSGESENRSAVLPQLSKKELLSLSEESQPKPNLQNDVTEKHKKPSVEPTDESQKALVKHPVPKARKLIHKATDPVSQREDLVPKPAKRTEKMNGISTPPRGILKRSSSSSSTDSEVRVGHMLDVQKKNGLPTATIFEGEAEKNSLTEEVEDSTQISLEKLKQVRFSSSTGKGEPLQSPQLHRGRETGEFGLLESDEIKRSGSDDIRSDSFDNKQISAVKPLGTYSSALQIKTVGGLQEDTSASGLHDTNRSVAPVNETLQTKTVTPKRLQTPQKTSSNILPNSNNELSVGEMHENKSNQILSHESKSPKNFTDEHQLSAKTDAHEVSDTNSTSLQQGKPDLVEEHDAKTTFKPDKHGDDLAKVADGSVSKVVDWFRRSSGTEDRKHVSARSQGRKPKEEVDFSTRTEALPPDYTGPGMDGKTEVTEELPFGKIKEQNSISPTSLTSEDRQLIKARVKPKEGEENEEQNAKSLTAFDCARVEEKECGQEIKQQNKKTNILEYHEHKLPAQICESEKAIREKRRIREIRAFWERDKTLPSHGKKEFSINTNVSGDGALKGLGESATMKPTAVYLPNELNDQSKNTLTSAELSCSSEASRNKQQNSFEFGTGHAVEKPERTLPSDGEVHEYTELPKASNLQPRIGATSAFPESKEKDEKETLQGKVAAFSPQKPSFQVLSLKEKMNEKSKNQISDPSQFQRLRNFWDTGVKLQSSTDRGDVSLPDNTSSITYERKSKEGKKGRDNMSNQELIQQQTQTSEREKTQKQDSVVCELPLGSPTLKGLTVTHNKNKDSVQLDRKPVIPKPQEKMSLPEEEVKECIEKSIVSSKEHHVSLQLLQSPGDKDALNETAVDDWPCLPIEKVENKTIPSDVSLPKEEVAETVLKVVLPKPELDVFKVGLKRLEKEASEMSPSLNLKANISKGTIFHSNQCKVFARTVEQSHDIFPADQKREIGKSTGKVNVPSTDEHENKKSRRKLFRQFENFYLQHRAADKGDALGSSQRPQSGLQNLLQETFASQPYEYRRVEMKTSDDMNSISQTNCRVESTSQEDTGQHEEVNETIEKSVAPSKTSGLSSALEKLLKETSETPPPKPKRADSTVQRTAEMEVRRMTYEHDGEQPQEIIETIEKSVAPSKASGLSSALEKLLKEASETPPPKPKRANSTVQMTAEVEIKSMRYEHGGEQLQEIFETIEKSVVLSKTSDLSSALEKLLKEASETPPPKAKGADKSMTYKHDGELPKEISETVEKSVAPSKVSGLSSALGKLLKEDSETPPPKPKRANSAVQRTAEMEVRRMTYEHDGEQPQEVSETIENSVAPSKVSGLSSALEKLLKEASETPPPKPKRADSTVQRSAEMEVRSTTYKHGGEQPEEITETIEKSVAPSKASGLSSALEKLLKEASETPHPKPKRADSTVQRTAEMEVRRMTYEHDGEQPQEISETIERSIVPSKVSGLSSALEKLLKEASETPPPKPKRADKSTAYKHDGKLPQEIIETIEKSVAPSKTSGLSSALEKLLKEASETPHPKPKRADSTVQRTAEMEVGRMTHDHDGEQPQEISETIEKSVAPSKVSGLSSALEKLLKEASEMPPPKPKRADSTVQRSAEMEVRSTTYKHGGELPQEISETIGRSALCKAEYGRIDVNLQKLPKEVSETPASVLENVDKEMQGKTQTSPIMHAPQQVRGHPQEIQETIEKTSISNIAKFNEFHCSLEKLLQEAFEDSCPISKELHKQEKFGDQTFPSQKETLFMTMSHPHNVLSSHHTQMEITTKGEVPGHNIKASVNDLSVSEIEASDLPKTNGAINKLEKRNMAPVDLPPLEGETSMIAIKPFKIKGKGRRDESVSLDASEENSEFKALLTLRRASTPLKDESNSPQPGDQFCPVSQHEDNDEEEGDSSNLGSKFSDENSDSYSATGSSTRSEEELNPVLMALKRSADRKMPSKSLEDIPSATSNKGKINNPKEELALSAEDVSTVPSQPDKLFSNPEKLKGLSKSVPSFLQEESDDRETDTASESSYSLGRIKKSPSSLTNLSGSSGMASLSSVSGSLMSIYSADFGNVDVKGNIQFAIDYVEQLNELHVFICQCKDLAVADVKRQRSDPYVKTYLLPEKYKLGKRKTSVKKKTFNPVYNEILRYKIEKDLLKNQSLNISVWHNDTFGRNSFLGEVELDLGTWDWSDKSNKQINWFPLKPRTSTMALELGNRGEMKLALQYVPHPLGGKKTQSTGEVHIWVKECHDLPILRGNKLNSFIKCTVLPDTSRKSRQKTRTVAKTTNPVFNHTMVYDGFRPEDLKEACIELTVWDHNKLANHFLGGLRIGLGTGKSYGTTVDWMDSTSDETALWEKMMKSPNTWIENTLPLRMLMVAKLTK